MATFGVVLLLLAAGGLLALIATIAMRASRASRDARTHAAPTRDANFSQNGRADFETDSTPLLHTQMTAWLGNTGEPARPTASDGGVFPSVHDAGHHDSLIPSHGHVPPHGHACPTSQPATSDAPGADPGGGFDAAPSGAVDSGASASFDTGSAGGFDAGGFDAGSSSTDCGSCGSDNGAF